MSINTNPSIDAMFAAGCHFGLGRSRRNPSIAEYVFTTKNSTDILDLEKTVGLMDTAKKFVSELAKEGKIILFVGGKKEASVATKFGAQALGMPFVDSRWIGGSLTNFSQIRKRIDRYEKLIADREKGELTKYTKRERMLIDKEIIKLEKMFFGIVSMKKLPDAIFIIDSKHEKSAASEALLMKIPIIALVNSDCNISRIKYPMIGNDASKLSVQFFVNEIVKAYEDGKKEIAKKA
jgi:small subunit ribosomal protein S2